MSGNADQKVDPSQFHSQVKELHNKPVRYFQFVDDEGIFSNESLFGQLNLENRRVKMNIDGSSKKKNLTNAEVAELKDEDEVSIRWPIKVFEKFYDYPAKVMPQMVMLNKHSTLQDHARTLADHLELDEDFRAKLENWCSEANIERLREAFASHIKPRDFGPNHNLDELNEEYEFRSYQDILKERENDENLQKIEKQLADIGHPMPANVCLSDELVNGTDEEVSNRISVIKQHIDHHNDLKNTLKL